MHPYEKSFWKKWSNWLLIAVTVAISISLSVHLFNLVENDLQQVIAEPRSINSPHFLRDLNSALAQHTENYAPHQHCSQLQKYFHRAKLNDNTWLSLIEYSDTKYSFRAREALHRCNRDKVKSLTHRSCYEIVQTPSANTRILIEVQIQLRSPSGRLALDCQQIQNEAPYQAILYYTAYWQESSQVSMHTASFSRQFPTKDLAMEITGER